MLPMMLQKFWQIHAILKDTEFFFLLNLEAAIFCVYRFSDNFNKCRVIWKSPRENVLTKICLAIF